MESFAERKRRDDQIRETINEKLIQSGEKDKLKEFLRLKLVDSGWRDEMKSHCTELIKNKGLDKITVEELVEEITPKGQAMVPDAIKAEMLQRIRTFLENS